MKYQEKPKFIEAEKFDGTTHPYGCLGQTRIPGTDTWETYLIHPRQLVKSGDYIIKHGPDKFSVMHAEQFEKTYIAIE